jgi:hypothetical protein
MIQEINEGITFKNCSLDAIPGPDPFTSGIGSGKETDRVFSKLKIFFDVALKTDSFESFFCFIEVKCWLVLEDDLNDASSLAENSFQLSK